MRVQVIAWVFRARYPDGTEHEVTAFGGKRKTALLSLRAGQFRLPKEVKLTFVRREKRELCLCDPG